MSVRDGFGTLARETLDDYLATNPVAVTG